MDLMVEDINHSGSSFRKFSVKQDGNASGEEHLTWTFFPEYLNLKAPPPNLPIKKKKNVFLSLQI